MKKYNLHFIFPLKPLSATRLNKIYSIIRWIPFQLSAILKISKNVTLSIEKNEFETKTKQNIPVLLQVEVLL